MAVIREQRNFRIGPVGVTRSANTGIVNESISEALSAVGQIQYEAMARRAEDIGTDAGYSAIVIDPETGLPQPLVPPKGFGSIASDAYDRVARNRFETSIQNEIQLKGDELSGKYKYNRNGASLYHKSMSDYVESMVEAADGAGYKSYIQDTGMTYRDLTTQKLALLQSERERAELIEFTQTAFTNANQAVESLHASNPEQAEIFGEGAIQGVIDAVNADLLPKSAIAKARTALMVSKTKGILRGITADTSTEDLTEIEAAFDNANPDLLPLEFKYLKTYITDFGNDFAALENVANFATEHLRPTAVLSSIREQAERREILNNQAKQTWNLSQGSIASELSIQQSIRTSFNGNLSSAAKDFNRRAIAFDNRAYDAFLDTDLNPANAALGQSFLNRALLIRSTAAKAILFENQKTSKRFLPEQIRQIVSYFNTGDSSELDKLEGLYGEISDKKTLKLISELEGLITSDPTGTVRAETIASLETILEIGDLVDATNTENTSNEIKQLNTNAFKTKDSVGLLTGFIESINQQTATMNAASAEGLSELAKTISNNIDESVVATVDGSIDRSLVGLTSAQADQQLLAIAARNPDISPTAESADALGVLLALEGLYPKSGDSTIWSKAEAATKSYRQGGANAIDSLNKQREINAANNAAFTLGSMDVIGTNFGPSVESALGIFTIKQNEIYNIAGITQEVATKGVEALRLAGAKNIFLKILGTNPSPTQANQIVSYFSDAGEGEDLTQHQKFLIQTMQGYANSILDKDLTKGLTSDMNASLSEVKARQAVEVQAFREAQEIKALLSGGGDVLQAKDRSLMTKVFEKEGLNLATFNSMDAETRSLVIELGKITPPSSFFESMERMAKGLPVEGANDLMSYYKLLSEGLTEIASQGANFLGDSISPADREILDDAFDVFKITGANEGKTIQDIIGNLVAVKTKDSAKLNLINILGDFPSALAYTSDYTTSFFGTQNPLMATELAPLVEYLAANGSTKKMVDKRLKAIISEQYRESPYIVDSSMPSNSIHMSRHSLEKVMPNPVVRNIFIDVIDTEVKNLASELNAIDPTFPDLRMLQARFFTQNADERAEQLKATHQFLSGSKEGNIYLEPDDTGAVLRYKAFYVDENNELQPLMFPVEAAGLELDPPVIKPVPIGTEGSVDYWASYSVKGTVGSLIADNDQMRRIDQLIALRANAKIQKQAREEFKATQGYDRNDPNSAQKLIDFVAKQDRAKLAQRFAPSELGN